jgi:Uma2 family endonuclease
MEAQSSTHATDPRPGGPVTLHGVSFDQYESLVRAFGDDHPSLRMTYLNGTLEIMTTSPEHELTKTIIARLLELWALERNVSIVGYGAATFRKRAKERGLEPDECYCRGALRDVPDLAIEVVHLHGDIEKLDVYAGLEVPEVWFWEEGRLSVHALVGGQYERRETSTILEALDVPQLSDFVRRALSAGPEAQTATVRAYRDALTAAR